ncbi:hypothetical protein D3C71_2005800 [compost metagenome]
MVAAIGFDVGAHEHQLGTVVVHFKDQLVVTIAVYLVLVLESIKQATDRTVRFAGKSASSGGGGQGQQGDAEYGLLQVFPEEWVVSR